jgi:uncharacterized repeat protein (TIGR03803 family)
MSKSVRQSAPRQLVESLPPAAPLRRFALSLCIVLSLALGPAIAQTYTDLHDFDCTVEGCQPSSPAVLAQGRDGNLYGTALAGGTFAMGTVFKMTPAGVLTTIYNFSGLDGQNPDGGLTLGPDGYFYGTTERGGADNLGTIFKITPTGALTTLHSFTNLGDGYTPRGAPVVGRNGILYGTTCSQYGPWFGYSITQTGVFTELTEGIPPCPFSGLTLGSDGNFYGTSQVGGLTYQGTVFRMTPAGTVSILHSFNSADGYYLYGPVVQGSDGLLYGTARAGGSGQGGVIFKLSLTGKLTLLRQFDVNSLTDGVYPDAGLVAATDGNFYGATSFGNSSGSVLYGNLFKINSNGNYALEYAFDGSHGSYPIATPMQHTNGKIYGLANVGGLYNEGAAYSLNMGIKPFVRLASPDAVVGSTIQMVGNGLKTATSVTFGAAPATFTAYSPTYLSAVVPANAVAGYVTVTTPTATFTSSRKFQVIPTITNFSPTSGTVGSQVTITGTGLLGATQVTFGGVQATSFTVNSATSITATVPTGAVTGKVVVKEPGTSGVSSGKFTVTP